MATQRNRSLLFNRGGYTLIELMASMAVLSIGVLSVLHLQVATMRGASFAREQAQALDVAHTVIDDLQVRALAWRDNLVTANDNNPNTFLDSDFAAAFPDIVLTNQPAANADLPMTGLRSLQAVYGNKALGCGTVKCVANDVGADQADLVNLFMEKRGTGLEGVAGAGSLYRIHYIAYPANLIGSLVRLTLFVSWDNKDFGRQDYNWQSWWNGGDTYWSRHVVSVAFVLARS